MQKTKKPELESSEAPTLPLSSLYPFLDNFLGFTINNFTRYPDAYQVKTIGPGLHFFYEPHLVKHVLVTNNNNYVKGYSPFKILLGDGLLVSEGKLWLRNRRLLQPSFSKENLKKLVPIVQKCTDQFSDQFQDCQQLNITDELSVLVITIVTEALFGIRIKREEALRIRTELRKLEEVAYSILLSPIKIPNWVADIPIPNKYSQAIENLKNVVDKIVDFNKIKQTDNFVGRLMKEDLTSDKEQWIKDEVMTFLLAGQTSVVPFLEWCFYILGREKNTRDRLREEIKNVFNSGPLTLESLHQMEHLRCVIQEIMRLYPPIYAFSRTALKDDLAGPYRIKAKSSVVINVFGLHRHPLYWKDPSIFNPERFKNYNPKKENKYWFIPFGTGARRCIADHFSLLEIQLILACVLNRLEFETANRYPVKCLPRITLKPKNPILINTFKY